MIPRARYNDSSQSYRIGSPKNSTISTMYPRSTIQKSPKSKRTFTFDDNVSDLFASIKSAPKISEEPKDVTVNPDPVTTQEPAVIQRVEHQATAQPSPENIEVKQESQISNKWKFGLLFLAFYILLLTLLFFFVNSNMHKLEKDTDFEFIIDEQLGKFR